MKFFVALTLLVVLALIIDHGDSWWRRRRRRSSRRRRRWGSKIVNTVKKGVGFYKKHKNVINPVVGGLVKLGIWDSDLTQISNLATLKAKDTASYNDFMQRVRTTIGEDYEEESVDEMMTALDELADMKQDELQLLQQDSDLNTDKQVMETDLSKDLTARVAALTSK